MAEESVSLKLDADASGLKSEVESSGEAMDELAGKSTKAGEDIEQSVTGATSAWDEHSDVINGAAAGMVALGGATEALARSQQDTRAVAGRLANQLEGETTDSVMGLAAEVHNATTDLDELVGMMETGRRQGIESARDLQDYALHWDMVGDATGESAEALAESSVALRALGIDAGNEAQALDAFGFITTQTTSSVGEFLRFIERTGPELRDMNADVDDAAAIIGVLESEFGMAGRTARQEFRTAVSDSDGTLGGLLETLGIGETTFADYRAEVAASSGVIEANAEAFAESRTVAQELWADVEALGARFSGLTDAASNLSPVLMGAGGVLMGLNQLNQLAPRLATSLRGGAGVVGRYGAAFGAAAFGASQLGNALGDLVGLNRDLSQLTSELELLAATGESAGLDDAVGGIEGVVEALDMIADPSLGQNMAAGVSRGIDTLGQVVTLGMLEVRGTAHMLEENLRGIDDALASMVSSGNADAATAIFEQIADAAEAEGIALETVKDALPGYARELDLAAASSDDAAGAIDGLEGSLGSAGGAFDDTTQSVEEYIAANRAAVDPVFALDRALQSVEGAQDRYNQALEEHGPNSDEARRASMDLMGALSDVEAAAIDGDLSFDAFRSRLSTWVEMGEITEAQAEAIRERVEEARGAAERFSGNYEATATLRARFDDTGIPSSLRQSVPYQHFDVLGRASGGPVWPGEPFLVGEEGPELVTFGQSGHVHDANTTAAAMTPTHLSPAASSSGGTSVEIPVILGDVSGLGQEIARAHGFITTFGEVQQDRSRDTAGLT